MSNPQNDYYNHLKWQQLRLNYFLVASAFLVTAFFYLVYADKCNNPSVPWDTLVTLVASLGGVIAVLYSYINFVSARTTWRNADEGNIEKHLIPQTVHNWGIPVFFSIFWIVASGFVTKLWYITLVVSIALFGLCILFDKYRKNFSKSIYSLFDCLFPKYNGINQDEGKENSFDITQNPNLSISLTGDISKMNEKQLNAVKDIVSKFLNKEKP